MFFFLQVYIPLLAVIGISLIKPLYVNRYVIPVTIAEVFLVVLAIERVKNPMVQKIIACTALSFVVLCNIWYPSRHAKLDIRTTVLQVNALMQKNDVILVDSPLIFFETIYYSRDRSKVFFYNPSGTPFPWYVGGILVSPSQIVTELPPYPIRAYVIHDNGSFEISYNTNISTTLR
jgi:hypothetical protein